ncbi:MAG: hypothetical protein KBH23_01610 [Bacteroidaceae bacterium]|nr:hypothetical protein [Bacteroidaceae bacterium]
MKQIINCSSEKETAMFTQQIDKDNIILTESQKQELQDYAIRKGITLKLATDRQNITSFKDIESVIDELSKNGFSLNKVRKEDSGQYMMSWESNKISTNFLNGHAYGTATFIYPIKKGTETITQICSVIIYFSWQIPDQAESHACCFMQSGINGYGVTSGKTDVSSDRTSYILGTQEVTLTANYNNNTLSENYIATFYCSNEGKVRLVLRKTNI